MARSPSKDLEVITGDKSSKYPGKRGKAGNYEKSLNAEMLVRISPLITEKSLNDCFIVFS